MPLPIAVGLVAVSSPGQAKPDKVSLEEQEDQIRQRCAREGWQLTEVIKLPGVKRSAPDIIEMFAGNNPKHEPYRRLRELINAQAFQILVSYDNGRVGRSKSLFTYLTENCVANGISVCVLTSGTIDEENEDVAIALGSISATAGLKRAVKMRNAALDARAALGKNAVSIPISHRRVRDEMGNVVHLEVNESLRPLWNEVADLLLKRVGWHRMGRLLQGKYSHPSTGKAWIVHSLREVIYNPYFWGNSGRYYSLKTPWNPRGVDSTSGLWTFDPNETPPPGVKIFYGTHQPVWEGDLAEKIKAELRRRVQDGKGRAYLEHAFSGLLRCHYCESRMVAHRSPIAAGGYTLYWRCYNKRWGKPCENKRMVRDTDVQEYIRLLLQQIDAAGGADYLDQFHESQESADNQIAALQREIKRLEKQLPELIERQTTARRSVQSFYTDKINEVSDTLDSLRASLNALRKEQSGPAPSEVRRAGWADLKQIGLEHFWDTPPGQQNQLLLRVFHRLRFICQDGSIIRISEL